MVMWKSGELVQKKDGVFFCFEGTITAESVVHSHSALYDHAGYHSVKYLVIDAMQVVAIDPDVPLVAAAIDKSFAAYNPELTVVFACPDDALVNRFGQYQEAMSDTKWTFHRARSLEEAAALLSSLGLPVAD